MNSLHLWELSLIKNLQLIRTPFLDKFFLFLNYFDTFYFPLILIPVIWFGYNWKWGLRLLYIIIISSVLNELAKLLFHQPRPTFLDPSVGVIFLKNFGFPSGAAQAATVYSGLMILYFKNKKVAWILGSILVFFISLSRVYLGVHFISDLIGGYILGIIVVILFYNFHSKIENFLSKKTPRKLVFINSLFCFSLFLLNYQYFRVMSLALVTVVIGLAFSKRFDILMPPSKSFKDGLFKILLFFAGALVIIISLKFCSTYFSKRVLEIIGVFLLGVWIGFFINLVWKQVFSNIRFLK